jgi:hypothetical protein
MHAAPNAGVAPVPPTRSMIRDRVETLNNHPHHHSVVVSVLWIIGREAPCHRRECGRERERERVERRQHRRERARNDADAYGRSQCG